MIALVIICVILLIALIAMSLATYNRHVQLISTKKALCEIENKHKKAVRRIIELEAERTQLEHDPATKLLSGLGLVRSMRILFDSAVQLQSPFSICAIGIDHFRTVYVQQGMAACQKGLTEVAEIIRGTAAPSGYRHAAGRPYGGRFFVALYGRSKQETLQFCESLQQAAQKSTILRSGKLGVSAGISSYPADAGALKTLIYRAEVALYDAQEIGNCVIDYGSIGQKQPKTETCPYTDESEP